MERVSKDKIMEGEFLFTKQGLFWRSVWWDKAWNVV